MYFHTVWLICIDDAPIFFLQTNNRAFWAPVVWGYCGNIPGKMPAVCDVPAFASTVCTESKNVRRVSSIPEKIFGVRNFNVIIRSPNPITRNIFIRFLCYEKDLNVVVTTHNTLTNYQIAPLLHLCQNF